MTDNGSMKIAGKRSADNWFALERKLGETPALWNTAFDDFFMERLNTRYLDPIRLLEKHGNNKGEGFSIVSLQCALIEFLQTTRDGTNFKDGSGRYKPEDSKWEYGSSSKEIFTIFLTGHVPFKDYFKNRGEAEDFYSNVRCSLLHEARTTNNWLIKTTLSLGATITKKDGKTYLQRNLFQRDLEAYIWQYKIELLSNDKLKEAFIRKFNALCDLPIEDPKTDTDK